MNDTLFQAATLIIPLVFAIVFHEVAHGYVAKLLGDTTAQERGRLSLNPLRHVDPIGTVVLPGILALMKAPIFGWARPVPVNMWRLRNPRRGMMLVAAAGPGTNLVLAGIGAVLLGLLIRLWGDAQATPLALFLAENLKNFLTINVFLALFNLLPVPPFDGSHIVEGLLPQELAARYARLRPYGFGLMVLLLLVLPSLFPGLGIVQNLVVPPVEWATGHYVALAQAVAGSDMPHGWIILDKPVGLGSTQAVAAVKRNLREAGHGKKVKVGHGGTLDPLASGILPIALGEATKLTGRMLDASKVYDFTVAFGAETDTLDLEGQVIATSDVRPVLADVAAVLPRFTGPIEQVPPAYSAIRVDGERAYDLARAGEAVEMKPRAVTVHALEVHGPVERGHDGLELITLTAHVSKGTYIRSLARDIARALGSVGHVTMLRRTKAGPFALEQAISLDKLNEIGKGAPLEHAILPLEAALVDIPALDLDPEQAGAVRQGRVLTGLPLNDGLHWARYGLVPVALMELSGGDARVVRGFNFPDVAE